MSIKKRFYPRFGQKLSGAIKGYTGEIDSETRERAKQALLLYDAGRLYAELPSKNRDDWIAVKESIAAAKNMHPTNLLDYALLDAYKALGDKKKYFYLNAYKYLDEKDPSPFEEWRLYNLYIRIRDAKKSYHEELEFIKALLIADIRRTAPPGIFRKIERETFTDIAASTSWVLEFKDEESEQIEKKTFLLFFSTTCGFCIKTLLAVNSFLLSDKDYIDKGNFIGIQAPVSESLSFLFDTKAFIKEKGIIFRIVENEKSQIFADLRVTNVPRIYILDERGRTIQIIQFLNYGHLEEKLSWLLDEYFD